MRSVLILGAGRWQLPLIARAKCRGFRVLAADQNPAAVGLSLCDVPLICDVTHPDAILDAVRGTKIDGVACDQTEITIRSTSKVAQALGLPHMPYETIVNATDKSRMRELWRAAGVRIPRFRKLSTLSELEAFAGEIGYPVITKPVSSSGSQGVRVSSMFGELAQAFEVAKAVSLQTTFKDGEPGAIIAEEFVSGREYTVEAFTSGGETTVLGISQKSKPESSFQVSTLLEYPPDLSAGTLAEMEATVKAAVSALGIQDGPSHSELLLSDSGPVMVETAARGGGFRISSEIIPLMSGFDQLSALLDLSLGHPVQVKKTHERPVTLGFFYTRPGTLAAVRGIEQAMELASVHALELFVRVGEKCGELSSDRNRAGYFILTADSVEEVRRATAEIYRLVQFEVV